MWLEIKYINLLSPSLERFKSRGNNLYNFRCPFCGDSATNKYKCRGYLYEVEGKMNFMCHNCGASMSFFGFLKSMDKRLFDEFKLEKFTKKDKKPQFDGIGKTPSIAEKQELKEFLNLPRISSLKDDHVAKIYLRERLIPEKKLKNLFFVEKFSSLEKEFPKYAKKLPGDARIVIPIFNREKKLIGLTARKMETSNELRYYLLKFSSDDSMIYNLERIDFNKEVFVFEGAFDSMFIENSVAVDGSDFKKVNNVLMKDRTTLIFDNQPKNLELVEKMSSIIDDGWKVLIWPENTKELGKDVNNMILNGLTSTDIEKIIVENTFKGLMAKTKFNKWRQISR